MAGTEMDLGVWLFLVMLAGLAVVALAMDFTKH